MFSLGAILTTAAQDHAHYGLELIYAGRVVSGLGIGGISAVTPAFVSECSEGGQRKDHRAFPDHALSESSRYFTSVGRTANAKRTLAYLRKEPVEFSVVINEIAEIEAQTEEESAARDGGGFWDAITARGGSIRFGIAFGIFVLQQWGGQNSVE
ncbi:hypothetical protein H0H87_006202 [Tephrocybe sp. NHM501043]|nr:hypothetical protein H0H87_006202 [Tephrocybe sp. NHM501043]